MPCSRGQGSNCQPSGLPTSRFTYWYTTSCHQFPLRLECAFTALALNYSKYQIKLVSLSGLFLLLLSRARPLRALPLSPSPSVFKLNNHLYLQCSSRPVRVQPRFIFTLPPGVANYLHLSFQLHFRTTILLILMNHELQNKTKRFRMEVMIFPLTRSSYLTWLSAGPPQAALVHFQLENLSWCSNLCYNRCLEVVFHAPGFSEIPEFLLLLQSSVMMVMFQMEILTF